MGKKVYGKRGKSIHFPLFPLLFSPFFPMGKNGKRHNFPMGKNEVGPPPPKILISIILAGFTGLVLNDHHLTPCTHIIIRVTINVYGVSFIWNSRGINFNYILVPPFNVFVECVESLQRKLSKALPYQSGKLTVYGSMKKLRSTSISIARYVPSSFN